MILRGVVTLLVWGYQNVLGNLVASAITTTVGLVWHHRRLKAHHTREIDALRAQLRGDDA